jgi:FtsP/CotA-like multicopper oxidase with cupredoxin domain
VIRLALLALVLIVLAPLGLLERHSNTTGHASKARALRFANALRIPPLLPPRVDSAGRKIFDLTVRPGRTRFLPGTTTDTWGVNGPYLGPTLRAARGDRMLIHVTNHLPEATTMHWHGMHLPAVDDGGPHETIEPGLTWSPSWTIHQPAATLWYHPHPDGRTADQVYRGVAGLFILDDARSKDLDLPDRYGIDDIPVIIQDKRFRADGSLDFASHGIRPTGLLGDTILLNGTYDPYLKVPNRRIRFRLLNASNARVYNVGFGDNRLFDLVATDAGFLDAPHRLTRIQLSPGERAEIVATFRPGERAVLRSYPPKLGTNFFLDALVGGRDRFALLQFRAEARLGSSPRLPRSLVASPAARSAAPTRTRRFELGDELTINGRRMDMSRIDAVAIAGSTELWEVHNGSPLPHNFHAHGVSFRVVAYADGSPPVSLAGPKDTVYVPPYASVRLLIHFGPDADPIHPFMFHCHLLFHEDRGMMGQFVLARPGQASPMHHHHVHGPTMRGMEGRPPAMP